MMLVLVLIYEAKEDISISGKVAVSNHVIKLFHLTFPKKSLKWEHMVERIFLFLDV